LAGNPRWIWLTGNQRMKWFMAFALSALLFQQSALAASGRIT
jgi:hypothetical protein